MYIAGRRRTASSPPRTLIDFASYLWPPCGVLLTFSLSPMSSPGVAIADVDLRRRTDPEPFGASVRAQNSFSAKQARRVCGIFRASPYPVIPASPGESETRRVPAPSHLAQRDVAKTHVSPSAWPSGLLAESRLAGHVCLADVSIQEQTRQPQDCTRSGAFSQVFETAKNLYKLSVSLGLQVHRQDGSFENL